MSLVLLVLILLLVIAPPILHISYQKYEKSIKKSLSKIFDFILWFKDDLLTKDGINSLTCDKSNTDGTKLTVAIFFFITLSVGLVIIRFFNIITLSLECSFYMILIALFLFFSSALLLFLTLIWNIWVFTAISGYEKVLKFPQSENFSEDLDHVGIIIGHCNNPKDNIFTSDSVSLLIDGLKKTNRPYRIYHIFQPRDFEIVYENNKVRELWILGHGDHGGLSYGNKGEIDYIKYSQLAQLDHPKDCIVQLHCNNGIGTSLKNINRCGGYVSNHVRMRFQNRGYIIKHFEG